MVSRPDSWGATHTFDETKNLNFGAVIKRQPDFSLLQGKEQILDIPLKKPFFFLVKFLKNI